MQNIFTLFTVCTKIKTKCVNKIKKTKKKRKINRELLIAMKPKKNKKKMLIMRLVMITENVLNRLCILHV